MIKIKHALYTILLFLLFSGCSGRTEELEHRVIDLEQELRDLKSELSECKNKVAENSAFEKEMECQEMLDRLKERWNNIVGCYYSPYYNTCMVKYMKNGEIKEAKIEDMRDD